MNKRVFTAGLGWHSAIMANGKWYDSGMATIERQRDGDKIYLNLSWPGLPVRQCWQLQENQGAVRWIVYTDVCEPIKLERMTAGIMMDSEYDSWIAGLEEGRFPEPESSWLNIFIPEGTLPIIGALPVQGRPGIIIENASAALPLLQTAPAQEGARCLRFELSPESPIIPVGRYRHFDFKVRIVQPDLFEEVKAKVQNDQNELRCLTKGHLRIAVGHSAVSIFWQERLLSEGSGLFSAVRVGRQWYDSSSCRWHLSRLNQWSICLELDWHPLPLRQYWQLDLLNDFTLSWKVISRPDPGLHIEEQTAGLVLNEDYRQWFGGYEKNDFPETGEVWQELYRSDLKTIGVPAQADWPGVMFTQAGKGGGELVIQVPKKDLSGRYLQTARRESAGSFVIPDFEQLIRFSPDSHLIKEHLNAESERVVLERGIEKGSTRLIAENGRLRLFRFDCEITRDIGIHTAFLCSDRWYDSSQAEWIVKKTETDRLLVEIRFWSFPMIQFWELGLDQEDKLSWMVRAELKEAAEIEEEKAGVVVSGDYRRWFNSFEQGLFPEQFTYWHDVIRNRDGEVFGTYPEKEFPAVMFQVDSEHLSLIQNTDSIVSGRVLQAQKKYPKEIQRRFAGGYDYFQGTFRLARAEEVDAYVRKSRPLETEAEACFIYGDTAQLHDRIAGAVEFETKMKHLRERSDADGRPLRLKIGVSRYNFFCLERIAQFLLLQTGRQADLRSISLNLFPLTRLQRNFLEYLDELKAALRGYEDLEFFLCDEDLFRILTTVYVQASPGNERQLLRMLGVVCEHAFIGPQIVVIDPFHRCNANCVHCWVHTPKIKHSLEFLDRKITLEQFRKIADDLSDLLADKIIFQGDGEPLLNPDFFSMVEYARRKGLEVSFFTNGILLNEENVRRAVELGVNEIFCSLPAGTAEVFGKVNTRQKPEVFGSILKNLETLTRLKKTKQVKTPRLIVTHVIHNLNARELTEMARNDINIKADVMRFYLVRLDENIRFLQLSRDDVQAIRDQLIDVRKMVEENPGTELLDTTQFQLDNMGEDTAEWSKNIFLERGCVLGWNFSLIPAAGDVSFCCHLRTVGYLDKNSFREIWESEEYACYRRQAKFMKQNMNVEFLNGTRLYDEYCEHCDTHQVIRDVWEQLRQYKLEEFITVNETQK